MELPTKIQLAALTPKAMSKEKDISASQFTFLQKIPDQLGYLIISGDAVVKVEICIPFLIWLSKGLFSLMASW